MKKIFYTHFGNKYNLDEQSGIYFQDYQSLQHFKKIVNRYPYFDTIIQYVNIFLEENNNMHTSFFDSESMGIHLLECHIEKYTVIHELTHCIQYLCGLMDDNDIEGTIFDTSEPIVYPMDYDILRNITHKNSTIREPAVAFVDILNSFGRGCYATIINTKSHIPSYYKADIANYILEAHSDYNALKYNNEDDMINKLPTELLDIIIQYDEIIQEQIKSMQREQD